MSRELECFGEFQNSIQREFQFNRVEFYNDSYNGIHLNLKYLLKVEMVYQSTLMKSTMVDEQLVVVRNREKQIN